MPEPFEKFVYPDFTFSVFSGEKNLINAYIKQFPDQEKGIRNYFRQIRKVWTWFGSHERLKLFPAFRFILSPIVKITRPTTSRMMTGQVLDKYFTDEKLKAVIISQWGDYGLPPRDSSFIIQAIVSAHYYGGGFYPDGGAGEIAVHAEELIKTTGGKILLNHEAEEIIIENGKAIGVKVRNLRATDGNDALEFHAPVIVSNAGAWITYERLIKDKSLIPFYEELKSFMQRYPAMTSISVHVGLSTDPRTIGLKGENYWIYSGYDHNAAYDASVRWFENGKPPMAYLSFPSLKDTKAKGHTAEIITFGNYEDFSKWKDQPWKKRDGDYQEIKKNIADILIAFADRHCPGFAGIVEHAEVSTPLTSEHFTGHYRGYIYALPAVPERFDDEKSPWIHPKTPVKNLYLAGADASTLGIGGALMGGLMATAQLIPTRKLLSMAFKNFPLKTLIKG